MNNIRIGITGHREEKLPKDNNIIINKYLDSFLIKSNKNEIIFNIGGAHGFDMISAEYCIKNKIYYNLYLPFKDTNIQIKQWNNENKKRYNTILKSKYCKNIEYGNGYFDRNRKIVDNSDIIITAFLGDYNTGTGYTLKYAKKKGISDIYNIFGHIIKN